MTDPIRVLIADDQALVRGSFRVLVETAPGLVTVGEAGTGAEAVELAATTRPDVVLMDIRMPEMDGIEATRRICAAPCAPPSGGPGAVPSGVLSGGPGAVPSGGSGGGPRGGPGGGPGAVPSVGLSGGPGAVPSGGLSGGPGAVPSGVPGAGPGRVEAVPRVLVLTTFDLDEYVYAALRAGASGFLLKDAPPADLLAGIRVVAAGEGLLAPTVTRRLIAEFARRTPPVRLLAGGLAGLTEREGEVLALIARGRSNPEIADDLRLRPATVKTHIGHLLAKLGARDRAQLVIVAYESGLVTPAG